MTGWRDAPLVEAKGSWRDAPLVAQDAPQGSKPKSWAMGLGPAAALSPETLDPSTPQGKAFLGLGLGATAVGGAALAWPAVASAVPGVATAAKMAWPYVKEAAGYALADAALEKVGVPAEVRYVALTAIGLRRGLPTAGAKVATGAAEAAAPAIAKVLPMVSRTAQATAPIVTKAAEAAAPVVSKAVAAATRHNALVEFAKQAGERGIKAGQKVWVELDAVGNPVQILTPDQARGAARRGVATTWIRAFQ